MMKKKCLFAVVTLIVLLSAVFVFDKYSVRAEDEEWNSGIWRLFAAEGLLSEEDQTELRERSYQMVMDYRFDIPVMLVQTEKLGGRTLFEYAEGIYELNSLGFGAGKDGLILCIDYEAETMQLRAFGRGQEIFTKSVLNRISRELLSAYDGKNYAGLVRLYLDMVEEELKNTDVPYTGAESTYTEISYMDTTSLTGEGMPYWYIEDVTGFKDFHDPKAPKVVDDANVYTEEQEAALTARILELIEKYGRDIVIFTDDDCHGMDESDYCAEFYTLNGYGIGEDYDGIVFFLSLDPENKCYFTAGGGIMAALWTEANGTKMDDVIDPYLRSGDYYGGFEPWFDKLDYFYHYDGLGLLQWQMDDIDGVESEPLDCLTKLCGTDEEDGIARRSKELHKLETQYGIRIVLYYDNYVIPRRNDEDLTTQEMFDRYYARFVEHYGIGSGEYEDALLVFVSKSNGMVRTETFGRATALLSGAKLEKWTKDLKYTSLGDTMTFTRKLRQYLKYGRVYPPVFVSLLWTGLSFAIAQLVAGFVKKKKEKKLKPVQLAHDARAYLVPGSLVIHRGLVVTVSVKTDYKTSFTGVSYSGSSSDTSSRSSSSSSGSSSRSNYTTRSGRTFSGTGRKL